MQISQTRCRSEVNRCIRTVDISASDTWFRTLNWTIQEPSTAFFLEESVGIWWIQQRRITRGDIIPKCFDFCKVYCSWTVTYHGHTHSSSTCSAPRTFHQNQAEVLYLSRNVWHCLQSTYVCVIPCMELHGHPDSHTYSCEHVNWKPEQYSAWKQEYFS